MEALFTSANRDLIHNEFELRDLFPEDISGALNSEAAGEHFDFGLDPPLSSYITPLETKVEKKPSSRLEPSPDLLELQRLFLLGQVEDRIEAQDGMKTLRRKSEAEHVSLNERGLRDVHLAL